MADPNTEMRRLIDLMEQTDVSEAPMDIDPVKIMAQRLDQLEKILDAYDPEKFKKIMMENLKGLQKFEAKLLVLEQMIEAVEDSAKRAFDHAQQQHLRLSSLKDYMNRGGDLGKVESVDVSGKPTFKDKYLGGAGDNLPAVNLQGGKKFQAKRARVIGKDWPTDK